MAILRNDSRNRYTVISQTITQDSRLSIKERGMLLTLLSLPDNWNFSVTGLQKLLPDGQTAICSALNALENLGYLKRNRLKDERGRFYDVEWLVFEEPQPVTDNAVSPRSDNTDVEMRQQSNTNTSNTKKSNTNSLSAGTAKRTGKKSDKGSFDTQEFYEAAKKRTDKYYKDKP